jgi:hypothetical protein
MTAMMIGDGKRVAAGGARLQWHTIPIADIDLIARNTRAEENGVASWLRGPLKVEWSDWDERHGRLSREGSGRAERERVRYNGATGMSDMAGKAAR